MNPRVFISYSHDSKDYLDWVRSFADRLIGQGIIVTLDQYDLALGDMAPRFMEKGISENDYVLLFLSRSYVKKAKDRKGGVGFEIDLASGEIVVSQNHRKFIPILVQVDYPEVIPLLKGVKSIRITNLFSYEKEYEELYAALTGQSLQKPELGPIRNISTALPDSDPFDVATLGKNKSLVDYCYWDIIVGLPSLAENSIAEVFTALKRHTTFESSGMYTRAEPLILSPFYLKRNHPEIVYESGDHYGNTTNVINYDRFLIAFSQCRYSFIEYKTASPYYHSPEIAEEMLFYILPMLSKVHADLGQKLELECTIRVKSSVDAVFIGGHRPLPILLRVGDRYVHSQGISTTKIRLMSVESDIIERFFNRILEAFTSGNAGSERPFLQVDHGKFVAVYNEYISKIP